MPTLLVFCTFPDPATARDIARRLVAEKLVACVNLLPAVTSIYTWQDKQEESTEILALLKTPRDLYPALEARLRALHPYEVPEIIAVEITAALPAYLQWVTKQTKSEVGSGNAEVNGAGSAGKSGIEDNSEVSPKGFS